MGDVANQWANGLGDPQVSVLIEEALAHNPDLMRSAALWEEANARVNVANSYLHPDLSVGYDWTRTRDGQAPDPATLNRLQLQATWELDVWGNLRHAQAAAESDAVAYGLDYAYGRQSLAATVAKSWFVAKEANAQLVIAQELLQQQELTATITQAKRDAGAGVAMDAEVAEANVALAGDAVQRARLALDQARRALELLLGRYPAAELDVARDLPPTPEATPATGLPAELLERRPDVIAADRRVAAAFHRVESAKAAKLPRVSLDGTLGSLLDPSDEVWSIGVNLLAPLLNGSRLDAQVKIANAQQKQALANYVQVGLQAFNEVETALASEHMLRGRLADLTQADQRLASASDIAQARYEAGVISILDLTQVRQQYFSARSTLLNVQSQLLQQRINLHLALGGSFDEKPAIDPLLVSSATPTESALDLDNPHD